MKVAIISDTHFGVRNDNAAFLDSSQKFIRNIFLPKIDEENITEIIHLGDLFDRRKMTNTLTAKRAKEDFITPLLSTNERSLKIIIGNHDTYYKDTNEINSVSEYFGGNPLISIYKNSTEIVLGEKKILLVPWVCKENQEHSLQKIKNSNADICMGHLSIEGFELYRGSPVSHGLPISLFEKFQLVLSGHFHHKSTKQNITYVGSHGQFTWSDYGDERGFHILDLDTYKMEFIENPYKMFRKIIYDDSNIEINEVLGRYDFESYSGVMTKVIVKNKTNAYIFEKFIEKMEAANTLNLQIIDESSISILSAEEEIIDEAQSTIDIIKNEIKSIENVNRNKLENLFVELYNRSFSFGG